MFWPIVVVLHKVTKVLESNGVARVPSRNEISVQEAYHVA